jgi:hypothetical protein
MLARRKSYAARYDQAPMRSKSCSTPARVARRRGHGCVHPPVTPDAGHFVGREDTIVGGQ